ncbi:lipase [Rhodococcus sp. BP-252]|uniref:lipase family protein n=1 Tax=unclassified Rhodococcus (in: high G+C Gram-positive bacteria) TaxID=192944 RepID=UPI001C9A39F9|nr:MULTISPECIES: lipase family protein [unclassified Rhodococcus (in: high G+C Gram-positive bacteria)]MBY6413782.1 lipase [Rhodococcus sp. BP-320]MBY6418437.1 lipase [Rhodococcus sp. BP-321]MBY6422562.1 lipase [Rhodococcus sp. BP-324]MBY6428421.1 lipase [Rhodococcus sp. BP-323]MBY6433598.1 lipase [Rhodococcus sp. BP-322]
MRHLRRVGGACALSAVLVAGACSDESPAQPDSAALGGTLTADYSGDGPGSLVSADDLLTVDRRLSGISSTVARVVYRSTSGVDGSATEVSGTIFAPEGDAPDGGWPIIAYGHGTTGVQPDCAPSTDPELLGSSPIVTALVRSGYVVAVSDYQGLGLDSSYHPYLDATTAANNLIDSVRAAQKLVPDASDRWASFGGSQGGQAAWAANELAGTYGDGLEMVGSVSLVPAADITGLARAAADGTLTADQKPLLQWVLVGLAESHPEIDLDDYRRGIVAERWDELSACGGPLAADRTELAAQIDDDDLRPATPEAERALEGYLREMSLPKTRSAAPMLVIYGGQDSLITQSWTDGAIAAACAAGDTVESLLQPNAGHADIDGAAAFSWITARFAGTPAVSTCPAPPQP